MPTRTASTPSLAMRLRYERLLRGLTQGDLARALDVSISQIQKYERGRSSIPLDRLQQLARRMDMTPEQLLEPLEPEMADLEKLRDGIDFARAVIATGDDALRLSMLRFIESVLADQTARG